MKSKVYALVALLILAGSFVSWQQATAGWITTRVAARQRGNGQPPERIKPGAASAKWIPPRPSGVNGGLIALTLRDQNGKLQVFTITPDGTNKKQLTFEGENGRPDWSPDGRRIAFGSIRNGRVWVAVMDTDGSNQKLLAEGNAPDWSPADNRIAFWSGIENQYGQIWVINADGTGSKQLTEDCRHRNSDDPSWSPDGNKILFSTGRSGRNELWVMDSDGSNEKRLSDIDADPFPGRASWQPAAASNSGNLDGLIVYAVAVNGRGQVFSSDPQGGQARQLTNSEGNNSFPAWSHDSKRIAFGSSNTGRNEIWVMDADGGNRLQLTDGPGQSNSDNPGWSPDGRYIIFETAQSGVRVETWIMNADGSNERLLLPFGYGAGRLPWQLATPSRTVANVSAASYLSTSLAPESILSAFGSGLATATLAATSTPLPTTLAGTTVKVRDSAGTERLAPLFFVSLAQINYQIPTGTANGAVTITGASGDGSVSTGLSQITSVAPGLFTANASGQGLAAALALRIKADGSQSYEPLARFDQAQNKFVAIPIDLGPESDQVFLILFGTGIRLRSSLSATFALLGGVDAQVTFAGALNGFVGLDQVNARLSRSLIGRGEVDVVLTVDGKPANTIKANIK